MKCSSIFNQEKANELLIIDSVPKDAEKIGNSSSSVYLGKDGLVYKVYRSGSTLPLDEVLMTRFYTEKNLPVAKVLGHSSNLLHSRGREIIVVKEFTPSKSKLDEYEETPPELESKMEKYEEVFNKGYKNWLLKQPEYIALIKEDPYFYFRMWSDVDRNDNWLYSNRKWILIDP